MTNMLLCDFHIHTRYSDGKLTMREVVDLYGQNHFDAIAITDHSHDTSTIIGQASKQLNMTITKERWGDYYAEIRDMIEYAEKQYKMLVLPGIEITKDKLRDQDSAHALLIGHTKFIDPHNSWSDIFNCAHEQSALVIAAHPCKMKKEIKNTIYFWNNRRKYGYQIDAWEVGNRYDLFPAVMEEGLPYIANSDFHKKKHFYSWKTRLGCNRNFESIKECIRENTAVAIQYFNR